MCEGEQAGRQMLNLLQIMGSHSLGEGVVHALDF